MKKKRSAQMQMVASTNELLLARMNNTEVSNVYLI